MDDYPKEDQLRRQLFTSSFPSSNSIYEKLSKQAVNEDCVQIRHFTIIDEAHYMLDFDNKPLRDLIAVGRIKAFLSFLATQNMDSFKSKYFDFMQMHNTRLLWRQQTMAMAW